MKKFCTACGAVDYEIKVTKGHILIEIFLWLCWIFPGLIYSIWRLSSRYKACPKCRQPNTMIPLDSPAAIKAGAKDDGCNWVKPTESKCKGEFNA